jgi:tol-pal system protein YbgF
MGITMIKNIFVIFLLLPLSLFAKDIKNDADSNKNLYELRRIILNLAQQNKQLQDEIQQLNGNNEVTNHNLEKFMQRQQNIETDINERLHNLENKIENLPISDNLNAVEIPIPVVDINAETIMDKAVKIENTASTDSKTTPPLDVIKKIINPQQEQSDYQFAFNDINTGNFQQAIDKFQKLLENNPQSKYASKSEYWLGESYYAIKKFNKAFNVFNDFLEHYPESKKRPHALLKLAFIYEALNNVTKAKEILRNIQKKYSNTASAQLAKQRLIKLIK